MSKAIRRTGLALLLLATILVAAHLFARQIAELVASTATGRQVRIEGLFAIEYAFSPRLRMSRVALSNPEWSERADMLTIDALAAAIDLRALLRGRLVLSELRLTRPVLFLEKTAQGPANWHFAPPGAAPRHTARPGFWPPFVDYLAVREGRVVYRRAGAPRALAATIDRLDAHAGHDTPLSLAAAGKADGVAYRLDASGAPLGRLWRAAGQPYRFSVHVKTARREVHATGHVAIPLSRRQAEIEWTVEGEGLSFLAPNSWPACLARRQGAVRI